MDNLFFFKDIKHLFSIDHSEPIPKTIDEFLDIIGPIDILAYSNDIHGLKLKFELIAVRTITGQIHFTYDKNIKCITAE